MGAGTLTEQKEGRAMKVIKKKMDKKTPLMFREFAGLKDLISFIETTPADDGWGNHASDDYPHNFRWCGAHSYTEAKTSLLTGVNVNQIKKAISRGAGVSKKPKRTLAVIGGTPNVPAYLAGNPACMYRVDKVKSRGAFNVFVDTGVHAGVSKSEVTDAGIEILIKVLQLANQYPVNLYVGDFGKYDGKIYGYAVKIIDAGRAFNTARVSYALTETGFLRVFGLAVIERSNRFWSSGASYGYGHPLSAYDRKKAVETVFKNAISLSTLEVVQGNSNAFAGIDAVLDKRGGRK